MEYSNDFQEVLTAESSRTLFDRVVNAATGGGRTHVSIISRSSNATDWARNRTYVATETQTIDVFVTRIVRGASGSCHTSCVDDDGIRQVVRAAEASLQVGREAAEHIRDPFIDEAILHPTLWSDATYRWTADDRAALVSHLIEGAETAGMLSAGTIQTIASETAVMNTDGLSRYYPQTAIECSMTVRHPKGLASGWAGVNHYDRVAIDPHELAARALNKCLHSVNPATIEPGRYTVILEPQATADLFGPVIDSALDRQLAEVPLGPFGGRVAGRSKINEQVLDSRLTVCANPMDPDGGFLPYNPYSGIPIRPITWVDRGILSALGYDKDYALSELGLDRALLNSRSFRLEASPGVPTSTVEEMIAHTERGILITRLSGVRLVHFPSLLCTGYTRDGVWLIEHGTVTKPIKNFRFTESPLFALNNLEEIGPSQRVFAPGLAHVAPAVRVRDFSLTGLADAI